MGALRPFFVSGREIMKKQTRLMAQAAMLAALYAVLTHLQNLLFPGSASWVIQFRASEALCVLTFFTPAAVPGLTLGCLLYNLTSGNPLPLDFLVGSLASFLATASMRIVRRWPYPALLLPAVFNGLLVGWELSVYTGGGFWLHALYVALGEAAVMLVLGLPLLSAFRTRKLQDRLF